MNKEEKARQERTDKARIFGDKRGERGQSLVETAIVIPILLLLLAAAIDFGRVFDAYIVLTNAAREGARFGSVKPSLLEADVQALVVDDVQGSGTNITQMNTFSAANVAMVRQDSDPPFVRVTVWYEFDLWFGGLIGIPTVRLTKVAEMPMFYAAK